MSAPEKRQGGRPPKAEGEHSIALKITLTPAAIARLDAMPGKRSAAIERLIMGQADAG